MLPLAPLSPAPHFPRPPRQGGLTQLLAMGVLALATACNGSEPTLVEDTPEEGPHMMRIDINDGRVATNGIITNGIITNGIITNGLSQQSTLSNGLTTNGLGEGGLATAAFATWFRAYPEADAHMAMHYLVACAVPAGQQRTWVHPDTGTVFTWEGVLGLAPDWAQGLPASEPEQQLVSACLAAMVNKYGVHVAVSVRGQDARGQAIAISPQEESAFSVHEAAFFGNLFTDEGLFVCGDRTVLSPSESSVRACGISSQASGVSMECPPLVHVGFCPSLCHLDAGRGHYTRCTTPQGKAYRAVTTRLRAQDIYRCGDGVCQLTESCDSSLVGVGHTYDSCAADCGRCQ